MNDLPPQKPPRHVTHKVQIEISWKSILRLLLALLATYAAIVLWPIIKLVVFASLIAAALYPVKLWVDRKGGPMWAGLAVASAILLLLTVGSLAIIAPVAFRQLNTLGQNLPKMREEILAQLPPSGLMRDALQRSMTPSTVADSRLVLERGLAVAETTVGGFIRFIVVIILAAYLMVDGPRALQRMILFFPLAERSKVAEALAEVSHMIFAYVSGQFLISVLAAAYLFLVLSFLGVPMALLLGIVAGICDVLPIIGFFIAVVLAMALGLTVSTSTAGLVFVLYGAYHLFENLYILPKVYGKKLKLPKSAVPLAVAAGGLLAGVVGAIVALPIVAAYPVVERLWLGRMLKSRSDTLTASEGSEAENQSRSTSTALVSSHDDAAADSRPQATLPSK